jgi:hypothetical protein
MDSDIMVQPTEENGEKGAHAYTPGLKIKRVEVVNKERSLPIEGEVLVNVGDMVDFDTVVARTEIPGDADFLHVSEALGIDPSDVEEFMLKKVGERFEKGELLAQYVAFWGLIKKYVHAPFSGYVENISGLSGQVIVRENNIPIEIDSYVKGEVKEILPQKGAIIETTAAFVQGIFGIGGENHGEIAVAGSSPDEILTEDNILPEHEGKIILGGSLITGEAYLKAIEIGVKGVIVGGMGIEDLIVILGEDIGVAITGEEKIDITIIITEGFGELSMAHRTFELLSSMEGRMASINGATQIRAGVLRPELIIPYDDPSIVEDYSEKVSDGMRKGSVLRVIREPYFGEITRVTDLPVELQKVETGSLVRVVEIQLSDGRIVTVPRANVEIIEE